MITITGYSINNGTNFEKTPEETIEVQNQNELEVVRDVLREQHGSKHDQETKKRNKYIDLRHSSPQTDQDKLEQIQYMVKNKKTMPEIEERTGMKEKEIKARLRQV